MFGGEGVGTEEIACGHSFSTKGTQFKWLVQFVQESTNDFAQDTPASGGSVATHSLPDWEKPRGDLSRHGGNGDMYKQEIVWLLAALTQS